MSSKQPIVGKDCFIDRGVFIGENVTIKDSVLIYGPDTHIEENVYVGERTIFLSEEPGLRKSKKTLLKRDVYIGQACLIKRGITIGSRAIVRSGTLVDQDVPPNVIVGGNPSRIIGYVDSEKMQPESNSKNRDDRGNEVFFNFPVFSDLRGDLAVAEVQKQIPFPIERVFVVYNVPSAELRGEHAHKECHQLLICVNGAVSVVTDDGKTRKEYILDAPNRGLHIPPMTWAVQYNYSKDAVLLVLASHQYNPEDYIRDYDQFLSLKRG